jgi:hypothetical protein
MCEPPHHERHALGWCLGLGVRDPDRRHHHVSFSSDAYATKTAELPAGFQ